MRFLAFGGAAAAALLVATGCAGNGSNPFSSLSTPIIASVSPNTVARGSSITIDGVNFSGTSTVVIFTGLSSGQVNASSGSATSISAVVPTTIPPGTYTVSVETTDAYGDVSSASNTVNIVVN